VRPILEQDAAPVYELLQRLPVEGTEAAPERQVMRAIDDVDRVELEPADVLHEACQAPRRQPARERTIEVLARDEERGDGAAREHAPPCTPTDSSFPRERRWT
jgi:hypothetical protein